MQQGMSLDKRRKVTFAGKTDVPDLEHVGAQNGDNVNRVDGVSMTGRRLDASFFDSPCIQVARDLLGKYLVRCHQEFPGIFLRARIVETEAYLGIEDKACHSFGGRRTERTEPMFMAPGTSYVYPIYGMYFCLNISSQEEGACVLLRALEPVDGIEAMTSLRLRNQKKKPSSIPRTSLSLKALTNGPSKLCQALDITRQTCNAQDLTTWDDMWVEEAIAESPSVPSPIVTCGRIGIDSHGSEWASKPWRFYLLGNPFVSVRNRKAEMEVS